MSVLYKNYDTTPVPAERNKMRREKFTDNLFFNKYIVVFNLPFFLLTKKFSIKDVTVLSVISMQEVSATKFLIREIVTSSLNDIIFSTRS